MLHHADQGVALVRHLADKYESNLGIVFAFDVAARGSPGAASYGICSWWGYFNTHGFSPCGLILQRGVRIGTVTNNVVEAHALANSIKMFALLLLDCRATITACAALS